MNPEQLRNDLRELWLTYYRDNRHWLSRLEIWITYNHQRRPSSSFILATMSVLSPQLTQLLPLLVDLNHDPDQMVEALGLNFNPEEALGTIAQEPSLAGSARSHRLPSAAAVEVKMGSAAPEAVAVPASAPLKNGAAKSGMSGNGMSGNGMSDDRSSAGPNATPPQQVLERPSRPIPRQGGKQPMAEITRRANTADSGCEGRDRPRKISRSRRQPGQ